MHSAERRLYEKLGMENPNKPLVCTSTVKEGPTIHKVRIVAHDGSKKIPPPVAAKPVFYKASVQAAKVPEKAKPSTASLAPGKAPEKKTSSKSMEDELAELTDLLVKNLDNTSDPDFFGKTSTQPRPLLFVQLPTQNIRPYIKQPPWLFAMQWSFHIDIANIFKLF